jgi:hypothetical protein
MSHKANISAETATIMTNTAVTELLTEVLILKRLLFFIISSIYLILDSSLDSVTENNFSTVELTATEITVVSHDQFSSQMTLADS